jgi:conjugative relaxase-like TrwC/TraI family protein
MMSMHKLTAGDGYTYLMRHVAAGDAGLSPDASLVAYYEATGNPPGRWLGNGLTGLGDDASAHMRPGTAVTEAAMTAVFRNGCDPLTGDPLGRSYQGRADRPVVGYDLTFTVPKSASVLWALGDDATRKAVHKAHRAAVDQALDFVEQKVARTRVGHAGHRQVRTRGVIAAAFDHWDTRTGDPNLHTHVVLANKVQGSDGAWRSLDGKTVHAATVTVSALYDSLLADELTRRLPVRWSHRSRGERRNPAFEIEGVDDVVLAAFSTRAEQIHCAEQTWVAEFSASHGRSPSRVETTRARQHLTRATRPAKVVRPLRDLLAEWANRARVLTGVEPHDLAARALAGSYARGLLAHDVGTEVRAAVVAAVLDDVATRRSVWTTWNLGAAAARATLPLRMASPSERLRLLNEVTTDAAARCVHLDDTRDPERVRVGEALYTSTELLAAEKVLIDASGSAGAPTVDQQLVDDPRYRLHHQLLRLAPDQRAAVIAVLASERRLDALVGPAGSGKTTTLAALAELWSENLGPVIGLAPSATAARALEVSLGVPCETTAKLLYETVGDGARARGRAYATVATSLAADGVDWRRSDATVALRRETGRWSLAPGQLVIVDEASLADTRSLAAVVDQAETAGAKVLLVGDHLQRGSVDAGGAFAMLARRGPTAELTSLRRFRHPWEARASLQLRHAQPAGLDAYDAYGAFVGGSREQVLDAAVRGYLAAGAEGRVSVLQAADNRTVRELNAITHSAGAREGAVRPGGAELHDGLVAGVGDRVVTRRNHRRLHTPDGFVRNGDLWDVVGVHDGALRVRAPSTPGRGGARRTVLLPATYVAEHVELGYATSTARTQGTTVDETHTTAAPGMAREDLYVAMSRGRDSNRVYVVTDGADDDCMPGGATPATSYREVLDGILATSHAEPTATDTWETYHPGEPAPLPVPPLRPPHDYGRSVSSRPPAQTPAPTSGRDAQTRIL